MAATSHPSGLWLVRHAQPLVAPGTCYGSTDMAADAAATHAAALALAEQLPPSVRVLHSPLRRCVQLAQALQQLRPDLAGTADARLAEMDFGIWEGWLWSDIPRAHIDGWTADFAQHRFGGRESVQELMDRVASAWAHAAASGQPTLWITHAGVMRAARLLGQGVRALERSDQWPRDAIAFGEILWLRATLTV